MQGRSRPSGKTFDAGNVTEALSKKALQEGTIPERSNMEVFRILQWCIIMLKNYRDQYKARANKIENSQDRSDFSVVVESTDLVISLVRLVALATQLALKMTSGDLKRGGGSGFEGVGEQM